MSANIRDLFLDVAGAAAGLLADPAVAAAWNEPSSLPKMTVQSLAGHVAFQVDLLPQLLATPEPTEPLVTVDEYYAQISWVGSNIEDEFNTGIRDTGARNAADGPAALADRVAAAVAELRTTLHTAPNRPVRRQNWGAWSITFDDFLTTRTLELIVHGDDLAHSVGVPTPEFPPAAVRRVVDILAHLAIHRHGPVNVLRALSRAERSPATISAF